MYCKVCYKQYNKGYKVLVTDSYGNSVYKDCCSKECCKHLQDKAIQELQRQIDLVRYQSFQETNY